MGRCRRLIRIHVALHRLIYFEKVSKFSLPFKTGIAILGWPTSGRLRRHSAAVIESSPEGQRPNLALRRQADPQWD